MAALAALDPDVGLAAIVSALNTIDGRVDGLEGLATSLNGYVDGLEALGGSTNTLLTTLGGYLDGLETLQGTANTSLTAIAGYVDALEAKDDALKASVDALLAAIKPAAGHFAVTASGTALANSTRRIVAGAAGTLTCTVGGVSVSYTVVAGQTLDVVATHITAAPAGTVGQF